jgi:hypothetical protein
VDTVRVGTRLCIGAMTVFVLLLSGCPSRTDGSGGPAPASSPQKCTKVGQTCEYSPNKLGSCVMRDNCAEDCLVCQSQH